MDPTKTLLIVQVAVQIILLGFVAFFIVLEKKRKLPTSVLDELKNVVRETQNLSESFHEQVEKKIEIVSKIMSELDAKIHDAERAISGIEKSFLKTSQSRAYTQEDVLKLDRGGFDPIDISRITGIPVGEIQLMIKVKDHDKP